MRFSFGVNAYAFVTMVLFLWLKIGINCQDRYRWELVKFFCLRFYGFVPNCRKMHYCMTVPLKYNLLENN